MENLKPKNQLSVTNTFVLGGMIMKQRKKDSLCHYNAQGSRKPKDNYKKTKESQTVI